MSAEWKNPDLQDPEENEKIENTGLTQSSPSDLQQTATIFATDNTVVGLAAIWACNLQLRYSDKGSRGDQDVSFYQPVVPSGYSTLGGYAQGNHHKPGDCVLAVKPANANSQVLIKPPGEWRRIWTDKNSGANMDGSIWQAESNEPDYVCLGSVAVQGYNRPNLPQYMCVHKCLVEEIPVTNYIWSDKGTGAAQDVSIYKYQNSHYFYAVPSYTQPKSLKDIKRSPICRL